MSSFSWKIFICIFIIELLVIPRFVVKQFHHRIQCFTHIFQGKRDGRPIFQTFASNLSGGPQSSEIFRPIMTGPHSPYATHENPYYSGRIWYVLLTLAHLTFWHLFYFLLPGTQPGRILCTLGHSITRHIIPMAYQWAVWMHPCIVHLESLQMSKDMLIWLPLQWKHQWYVRPQWQVIGTEKYLFFS